MKPKPESYMQFGKHNSLSNHADAACNRMRDAYRAGQRVFRNTLAALSGLEPSIEQLEDQLSMISDAEQREGFAMGWQSDFYAYNNGLTLSVMGNTRYEPEDWNASSSKIYAGMAESDSE